MIKFLKYILAFIILMILVCIYLSIAIEIAFILPAIMFIVLIFMFGDLIKKAKENPGLYEPEGE